MEVVYFSTLSLNANALALFKMRQPVMSRDKNREVFIVIGVRYSDHVDYCNDLLLKGNRPVSLIVIYPEKWYNILRFLHLSSPYGDLSIKS